MLAERWWVDVAILIHGLDEWSALEENVARLVDREDYWLTSEYTTWVTDPDDPEVQAAREQAKREGKKAPAKPLIWPVAVRPAHAARQAEEEVARRAVEHERKATKRRKVTIAQLRSMRAG